MPGDVHYFRDLKVGLKHFIIYSRNNTLTVLLELSNMKRIGITNNGWVFFVSCNTLSLCEISGSHGGKYEDDCLLGCCAV
jgi:hypothetical protein